MIVGGPLVVAPPESGKQQIQVKLPAEVLIVVGDGYLAPVLALELKKEAAESIHSCHFRVLWDGRETRLCDFGRVGCVCRND